jgi:DNA processing protein
MRGTIEQKIEALISMKKYPHTLQYSGNLALLEKKKISIVGSRKPSQYTKMMTHNLSLALSKAGICIVSGGAMGVDAIAHNGAKSSNTIAVLPNGLNHKYPAINKNLLSSIEEEGLILSQFDDDFKATSWSFVVRNELVVALGNVLIVSEAELGSGSMRSIEFALEMGKKIYVLPHRIGESSATNRLLQDGKAEAIYDIANFVTEISGVTYKDKIEDEFIEFCKTSPTYDEAIAKYGEKLFESELDGVIEIRQGRVFVAG